MPKWSCDSDGRLNIIFLSREDWLDFVERVVRPTGRDFGLDIEVKEFKRKETRVPVRRL